MLFRSSNPTLEHRVKTDVASVSPTRVKLTVTVPFEELKPSFDSAYAAIAQQVRIPGFRKGKVPARVIEQRLGRAAILEEVVNDAVPKAYQQAVEDSDIVPVGTPELEVTEIDDGVRVIFTAEVDIRPDFDLPDYKGISVVVTPAVADDKDVEEHIDRLRTRFASLVEVARPCADGDVILVDVSGTDASGSVEDDVAGSALSYEVGSEGMLPGFDDAIRGAQAGETRELTFTPSQGEWADQPLTVAATVTAVRERELPTLDEEFVTMASEFDSVDELRDDARERVMRIKRMEQGQQARALVHEALMANVDFPIPENLVKQQVDEHFHDGHEASDEHRVEVAAEVRETVKNQFVLDKIAESEEVTVGESELSAWLLQQAPRYGMTPDALADALVKSGQVGMAMGDIRRSKAMALVMENAQVTDENGDVVDIASIDEEFNKVMAAAQMAQYQVKH